MLFIKKKKAFTLIEILIGILLVSTVMVSAFQALSAL
jgi:prepilin-type N-terminal cleavage/methylation domain-containing protein